MDSSPLFSALIGLVGVAVGGMTSIGTAWLTQTAAAREKRRQLEVGKREKLFNDFVIEASRLYAIALSNDREDVADLVKLYSLIGRIRLICTPRVIEASEHTLRMIIDAYVEPSRTIGELRDMARGGGLNPLGDFDDAGREELMTIWNGRRA